MKKEENIYTREQVENEIKNQEELEERVKESYSDVDLAQLFDDKE